MRNFRASVIINWDFESDKKRIEIEKIIAEQLYELVNPLKYDNLQSTFFVSPAKRQKKSIKLKEIALDEVFSNVPDSKGARKIYEIDGVEYSVKIGSNRYLIFKMNPQCVSCGLTGTKMFLEKSADSNNVHFGFYGLENDKLILMTKDHIYAKSKGGSEYLSNFQTMCSICNALKASLNLTLDSVYTLRQIYNRNLHSMCKRRLASIIDREREKLKLPWPINLPPKFTQFISKDLGLIKGKEGFYTIPLECYNEDVIGCMKIGTPIEPILGYNDLIYTEFSGFGVFISEDCLTK